MRFPDSLADVAETTPVGRAPSPSGPFRLLWRHDRGSAILETAIAVPVLVVIASMMLWAMSLGVTSLALASQARDVARAIARGESNEAAIAGVAKARPSARVRVDQAGAIVTVSVLEVVSIPLPLFEGLEMTIAQGASAHRETIVGAEVAGASN